LLEGKRGSGIRVLQGSDREAAGKESTGSAGLVAGLRLLRPVGAAALAKSLPNPDLPAYNGCSGYRTPLMRTRLLRASLAAILAGTFGLQLAHADIYTWVDASGSINVSNLAPPEGVRVASVMHASAPATATRAEATEAARQAEVQALAERVRELEDDVELAKRQAPPPVDYRAIPPPVFQYVVVPPPPQYAVNPAPPANSGCDPAWIECGLWGIPGIYPTSIVVLRAPNFRRFHPGRGGHPFVVEPPMRAGGAFRRG
jgi:hypothetical protein